MTLPRCLAFLAAAVVVSDVVAEVAVLVVAPDASDALWFAGTVGLVAAPTWLGLLVARRRPGNLVGPLLVVFGAATILVMQGDFYRSVAGRRPGLLPAVAPYLELSSGSWMFLYLAPALLMLLFPDGRLPGRRWRWVAAGLIALPFVFCVLGALNPAPFPPPFQDVPHVLALPPGPLVQVLWGVAVVLPVLLLGLLVASATGMVRRYRRTTDPTARAQLKWFALGASFLPATLLLCWLSFLVIHGPALILVGLAGMLVAIPVATAIAMFRHDLYDVDRLISSAATYGLVTVGLLTTYTVVSFVAGLVAGRSSPAAAAAATAACAVALAPLRGRLQRRVDRRLYPMRSAALAAVHDLQERTHAGTARPEQLETVLRSALPQSHLRVGYRLPGSAQLLDATGREIDCAGAHCVPVRDGGTDIGAVIGGSGVTRQLLQEVASASTLLVEVVRLRIELSRALEEVELSRARLLHAGYQERRRLERDLHDGAQQRLVSLGMAVRLAQRHLGEGGVDVHQFFDQTVAELARALAELRQIAHGLRPSSLDDGLAHALRQLVGSAPVPVTLDVYPGRLPDDVATTAYYVASEAVTNAVKHASAPAISVRVTRTDGHLTVQVSDDGRGGAQLSPGTGLAGLADRISASGGQLRLTSHSGRGTVVEAVLPCAL